MEWQECVGGMVPVVGVEITSCMLCSAEGMRRNYEAFPPYYHRDISVSNRPRNLLPLWLPCSLQITESDRNRSIR